MDPWPRDTEQAEATPLCVYCWPIIRLATCEHRGHPCCGRPSCLGSKPALPGYMLKPHAVSLFDEVPD